MTLSWDSIVVNLSDLAHADWTLGKVVVIVLLLGGLAGLASGLIGMNREGDQE